jgi:hypothetical protein
MFSIPCIVDQFIKKYQQDVTSQYFISCFVNLYIFRTRSVSIIRRSVKLTESVLTQPRRRPATRYCYRARCCICSQFYWSPDDGHGTCPKHVEIDRAGKKVLWCDILLVFLDKLRWLSWKECGYWWSVLVVMCSVCNEGNPWTNQSLFGTTTQIVRLST